MRSLFQTCRARLQRSFDSPLCRCAKVVRTAATGPILPSHARDQAFHWVGSAAFSNGHPGELCYFLSGIATVIHGSTDGDSADEFQIQLTGHPTLAATDFVL